MLRTAKPGLVAAAVTTLSLAALALTGGVRDRPKAAANASTESGYPVPGPIDNWDQGIQAQAIRTAGLRGDRFQIPAITAWLQKPPHPDFIPTALHALARLGATEALPTIDALRQQRPNWGGDFGTVARARLVAEASSKAESDPTRQAAMKVDRFYHELGLSPAELTSTVSRYRPEQPKASDSYSLPPLEVYAMRELADIVYMGSYSAYAALPGVADVDFSKDYPSFLKIRLAPLSQELRLSWLINDLAHKKTLGANDSYEMQLAADGGTDASHLAMSKLWEMDNRRDVYIHTGFAALFEVLDAIRDKDQGPIFVHFAHDRDPFVAHYCNDDPPHYQFVSNY